MDERIIDSGAIELMNLFAKNDMEFMPLIPFDEDPADSLPVFPLDALLPVIRNMAEGVANEVQFPVDGVVMQIFGVLSLCLMGKYTYEVFDTYTEDGINTYSMCIAPTGERKTSSLKKVTEPFYTHVRELNKTRRPEIYRSQAEIKAAEKRLKQLEKELEKEWNQTDAVVFDEAPEEVPVQVRYEEALKDLDEAQKNAVRFIKPVLDDATVEAIAAALQENNERLGILSDEGGILQILAGVYSKSQPPIDLITKSYSGEPVHSIRVTRGSVDLENPFLTIHLSVQPIVMKEAGNNDRFKEQGLLARFLYCYPKSLVGKRYVRNTKKCPDEVIREYATLIADLYDTKGGVLRSERQAAEMMEKFSDEIENRLNEDYSKIVAWGSRLLSHASRIAATLHVVKYRKEACSHPVEVETVESAIKIAEYLAEHAKVILNLPAFTQAAEVRDARYIFSKLCRMCAERKISRTDLRRACRKFDTNEEMEPGLDELVRRGYVSLQSVQTNKKGSPPTTYVWLNPELGV